jgi:hypothetical protein
MLAPPAAAYVLALDAALVHLGPRTQPVAVYLHPRVHLPAGTLQQRQLRVTEDRSPCTGIGVIELLPARRDPSSGWVLESITRPVHVIAFGDLSRISCVGQVCATRYTTPIDREEVTACPEGGKEFSAPARRNGPPR